MFEGGIKTAKACLDVLRHGGGGPGASVLSVKGGIIMHDGLSAFLLR